MLRLYFRVRLVVDFNGCYNVFIFIFFCPFSFTKFDGEVCDVESSLSFSLLSWHAKEPLKWYEGRLDYFWCI